jgi:hypothetical protein
MDETDTNLRLAQQSCIRMFFDIIPTEENYDSIIDIWKNIAIITNVLKRPYISSQYNSDEMIENESFSLLMGIRIQTLLNDINSMSSFTISEINYIKNEILKMNPKYVPFDNYYKLRTIYNALRGHAVP